MERLAEKKNRPKHQAEPLITFDEIDFADCVIANNNSDQRRRTIIISTLGDPKITVVDIQKMMEAGMNACRFITSHMTAGDKIRLIGKIDKASRILAKKNGMQEWPCATCVELKTSFISTGLLEKDHPYVLLKANTEVILTHNIDEFDKCNETRIFVDNPYITKDVVIGMELSIKQDKIILRVKEILENSLKCVVIKEGKLLNMEPLCMTGATRTRPYITKKDLELAKFAVEYQVDVIIVNYVRHPETLRQIKKYMGSNLKRPFLISGICTYEGLCNMDDIIKETDGILLSRELLAYELDRTLFYRMAKIQKCLTGKCRQAGKPIFISGQVFEQTLVEGCLQHHEVSDVTHCLLDGASGFILDYCDDPDSLKFAIKELSAICAEIEPFTHNKVIFERNMLGMNLPMNAAMATAASTVLLSTHSRCNVIIIPTVSGRTIYYLNHMRPLCTILAVTTNIKTFRLLQIFRSVLPLFYAGHSHHSWFNMMRNRISYALEYAIDKGMLKYGDFYITLEKGAEESSYCDTVKCCKVVTKRNADIRCENSKEVIRI